MLQDKSGNDGEQLLNLFVSYQKEGFDLSAQEKNHPAEHELQNRILAAATKIGIFEKKSSDSNLFTIKVLDRLSEIANSENPEALPDSIDSNVDQAAKDLFKKIQTAHQDQKLAHEQQVPTLSSIINNVKNKYDRERIEPSNLLELEVEVRDESHELPLERITEEEVSEQATSHLATVRGYTDERSSVISRIGAERLSEISAAFGHSTEISFTLSKQLGQGGNNAVYEAVIHQVGEETFAFIQPLEAKPLAEDVNRRNLISILADIRGLPNVGEIKAVVWKNPPKGANLEGAELHGFLTEKMDFDLASILNEKREISLRVKQGVIKGILTGVAGLHSRGIVHQDLKPANIMFKDGIAKIIDHELAIRLGQTENADQSIEQTLGTLECLPPDIVGHAFSDSKGEEYKDNAKLQKELKAFEAKQAANGVNPTDYRKKGRDRYAAGLILYEVLTGEKAPWILDLQSRKPSEAEKYKQIALNHRDTKVDGKYPNRARMMQKMAESGPEKSVVYADGKLKVAKGISGVDKKNAEAYIKMCMSTFELLDPDPRKRPDIQKVLTLL